MSQSNPLLYLSRSTLDSLHINAEEVIARIEHLLIEKANSRVQNAPKCQLMPESHRLVMTMLCASDDPPFAVVKAVGLNSNNSKAGLDHIGGVVTLFDWHTGLPLCVMNGAWITAIRTAGLSSVAAKRLGRSDASIITFIGCGVQARSHLDAFSQLFPLKQVRAVGRGQKSKQSFCEYANSKGFETQAMDDPEAALREADIVVTSVTLGVEPFLSAKWMKPGSFANITDLNQPWIDEDMSDFDRIVIDDIEQEKSMPNPLVDPELIDGDLTGLATKTTSSRQSNDERLAFVYRGLGLGDLALASLAYEKACEQSKGVYLDA